MKTIKKITPNVVKEIKSNLEAIIKKHGITETRLVVRHYFSNYQEVQARKKKIDELQKEIQKLKKEK